MKLFLLLLVFTVIFESSRSTPGSVCTPNAYFKLNGETCRCDYEGSNIKCSPDEQPELVCTPNSYIHLSLRRCRCNNDGQSFHCTVKDKKDCKSGYKYRKDCNSCWCGTDFCTELDCSSPENRFIEGDP